MSISIARSEGEQAPVARYGIVDTPGNVMPQRLIEQSLNVPKRDGHYFFSATAPAVSACATLEIWALVSSKGAL